MQWHYGINGQQYGPVDEEVLFALTREGKLKPDDYVWNATMGNQWAKASTVPSLFAPGAGPGPAPVPPPSEWSEKDTFVSRTHNRELMAQARTCLSGYWGIAVVAVIVYAAVLCFASLIPLASLLISGPLTLGLYTVFLSLAIYQPPPLGMLFDGFKQFGVALGAFLLMAIFVFLWTLPLFVFWIVAGFHALANLILPGTLDPSSLQEAMLRNLQTAHSIRLMTVFLFILLSVILCVPGIIATIRYSMTYFFLAEHPEIGPLQAIWRSNQMMRGNEWKYFCLQMRFLGWMVLCGLTCGIGWLWLVPYTKTSEARFYEDLREGRKIRGRT